MAKIVVGLLEAYVKSDEVVQDLLRGCGVRTEDVATVKGGAVSVLTQLGVPEGHARQLADGLQRGGSLITVQAMTDEAAVCVAALMRRHGAADIVIPPSGDDLPPGSLYVGPDRRRGGGSNYKGAERRTLP